MRKADLAGIISLSILVGFSIGMMVNHEVSYYSGKMEGRKESVESARNEVRKELKSLCPSWFTDSRKGSYMACRKAELMK
jgi:hypothetical protein